MAQRDDQHPTDGYRGHDTRDQMGPYADSDRQYGGPYRGDNQGRRHENRDPRYGGRGEAGELHRNDPAQASYGRFGAPDVRHRPSGGTSNYGRQERSHNDSYGYGGYGSQGFNPGRDQDDRGGYGSPERGYRARSPGGDGRYGDDEQDRGRFQGGSGGYASNTGVYASSQTYGGPSDQLGYGSNQGGERQQGQHDSDYQQWRDEQMRHLDNDYHAWRGERYKKFSDEFGEWRRNRPVGDDKRSASGTPGGTTPTSIGAGPGGSNTGASGSK